MATILVIEDDRALRSEIAGMLSFEDYRVYEAQDGAQGIYLARTHRPDLVICDVSMPVVDGFEVVELLRNDQAITLTPFVFLTARTEEEDWRRGMNLGANDYIKKPFKRTELLNVIDTQLSRHRTVMNISQERLETARKNWIRTVSHELRTPLVSIMGTQLFLEDQLDSFSPDELKQLVGMIGNGSRRLSRLVDQTTLVAEIEAGMLSEDTLQEVGMGIDLSDRLDDVIGLARQLTLSNPDCAVALNLQEDPVIVWGHYIALRHALAEIIANAMSFSRIGAEVSVSLWHTAGRAWVTVADRGPGISQRSLDDVWEAFGQIDRERMEQQGVGLGLFVAQQIIELHGGKLKLVSEPGKGTYASVSLPLNTKAC